MGAPRGAAYLILEEPGFNAHPLAVRGIYLALIAVLLGYMGFYEERTRRELAQLNAEAVAAIPGINELK